MKVIKIYGQTRRDCKCDLECENCGNKETYGGAYDDRNFWDNVIPVLPCLILASYFQLFSEKKPYQVPDNLRLSAVHDIRFVKAGGF